VIVTRLAANPLRSLDGVLVELPPGTTSIIGPNGAGKTNLLEALYFALTGRSFRTSDRRELIPHGESLGRSEVTVDAGGSMIHRLLASVTRLEGRRHLLDGAPAEPAEIARHRPRVTVFSPDRLILVKGPPGERRAHLDGLIAARWPARGELRRVFGQALAQRNALLGRVAAGFVSADELDPWDHALATTAAPLIAAREEACGELTEPFAEAAEDLGLPGRAEIAYAPRSPGGLDEILAGLRERRDADLRLGRTSWGPHLDDVKLTMDGRALRRYGSQGQQRVALLALMSAERRTLLGAVGTAPLMLLDDVMSELDPPRRDGLVAHLAEGGQTLITAADAAAVPRAAREFVIDLPINAAREVAA